MDNDVMVSIICNTYNHEKYIRDALEGFVMQKTTFPFEVLVHDDASTDHTSDIIREYQEKYPDIIKPIYQTENQYSKRDGTIGRLQRARVQGKYVALCEGDDYWIDPLKLQKQVDFLDGNPEYSLCACGSVWYNLKTGLVECRNILKEDRDLSLEDILLAFNGDYFQTASMVLKAEVYVHRPEWMNLFPIGDYPLTVHAALNGNVHLFADVMAAYRYYADNSWAVRMDNDVARADISRRMIEGLEALDKATDYAYHEVINQRVLKHAYTFALMTHDYKALHSEKLQTMYEARSALERISDIIHCKYPTAYTKLVKPMARYYKSIRWQKNKKRKS